MCEEPFDQDFPRLTDCPSVLARLTPTMPPTGRKTPTPADTAVVTARLSVPDTLVLVLSDVPSDVLVPRLLLKDSVLA